MVTEGVRHELSFLGFEYGLVGEPRPVETSVGVRLLYLSPVHPAAPSVSSDQYANPGIIR